MRGLTTAGHLAAACVPQVDTIAQSNSKDIMRRPIHKVEVEVILQRGRIQHLNGGNCTCRSVESLKMRLFMP
jgi:hypothetical protein